MRIISGQARGRKLQTPKGDQIRPTADRAREALFRILGSAVAGCRFVDLFAGTGAVGLEALSRGADSCVFVDFHKISSTLIAAKSRICGVGDRAVILKRDLRRDPHDLAKLEYSIDILFMDPPYNRGFSKPLFVFLDENPHIFSPEAILVIEESEDVTLPEQGEHFRLNGTRHYGEAVFWIYTLVR
jgi:16S rRNA (guanine966-N2)-methyltransferase